MVQKSTVYKKNKKMPEKSVFPGTLSPEMASQSFPVPWFCTLPEVKCDAFGSSKHRQGKSLSKYFCYFYQNIVEILLCNKKNLSFTL